MVTYFGLFQHSYCLLKKSSYGLVMRLTPRWCCGSQLLLLVNVENGFTRAAHCPVSRTGRLSNCPSASMLKKHIPPPPFQRSPEGLKLLNHLSDSFACSRMLGYSIAEWLTPHTQGAIKTFCYRTCVKYISIHTSTQDATNYNLLLSFF